MGHACFAMAGAGFRACFARVSWPIDSRFANDILLLASSHLQDTNMLRSVVDALRNVGLILNATLDIDTCIEIVHTCHTWLGCSPSMSGIHDANMDLHVSSASRACWANKWFLRDEHLPATLRIRYFEAVLTLVACFGAGHRKIHHHHLHQFDCEWRRLLRTLLCPPRCVDWSLPRHEIPHQSE